MGRITYIVLALPLMALLSGCAAKKDLPTVATHTQERVEVRTERIFIKDTAYVEIPSQSASIVTHDTCSTLENDFAKSRASIDSLGLLHHSLETKPQKKPVEVEVERERRDSVAYRDREVKVPYPVERELGRWERTCIEWFAWVAGIALVMTLWVARRPIVRMLRKAMDLFN